MNSSALSRWAISSAMLLLWATPAAATNFAGPPAFSASATATRVSDGAPAAFVGDSLRLQATANGFKVEGFLDIHTAAAGLYSAKWTVTRDLAEPPALFINTSTFEGTMNIPAGGTVNSLSELTDHLRDSGEAFARDDHAGAGWGTGLDVAFGASATGPVFKHGADDDALFQSFIISFTAPDGFRTWLFEFPPLSVDSLSAPMPVPEPSSPLLLGAGLLGLMGWNWRRLLLRSVRAARPAIPAGC